MTEMTKLHDVQLWTFGTSPMLEMEKTVVVLKDHNQATFALNDVDLAVYQIGNNWPFHGEIMLTALRRPGIIVLHDYTLQHLMAAYCFEILRDPDLYVNLMRDSHGEAAAAEALGVCSGARQPVWATDEATQYPLTPAVVRNAIGVVVHSDYALRAIQACYDGPVITLPLPYESPIPMRASMLSREELAVPTNALLVITTGHMNPNKRPKQVIAALGMLPESLKARVLYVLLGPVEHWYANELRTEAANSGLTNQVVLEGYVADERLQSYIAQADLCVNLRYPSYEGASASLIEQLLAGKAVITSNTGSFAELPSDVVHHVHSEDELPEALSKLLSSREYREQLAARGQRFAQCTHRADSYAAGFSAFAERALQDAPVRGLQQSIAERVCQLGLGKDDPWAKSLNERLRALFGVFPGR